MGLKIQRQALRKLKLLPTLIAVFALVMQPVLPLNLPEVLAASKVIYEKSSASATHTSAFSSELIDTTEYENLKLSFEYEAEGLDNGDSFTYGYRTDGNDTDLGTFEGKHEGGANKATDETSSVMSSPFTFKATDLQLYIKVDVTSAGEDDVVNITKINLSGDEVVAPIAAPELTALSARLHDNTATNSVNSFKGISVQITPKNLKEVQGITGTVTRASGSDVVKTDKESAIAFGNAQLKAGNASGGLSMPFPFSAEGNYDESTSQAWNPAPATWSSATVPRSFTILFTFTDGTILTQTVDIQNNGLVYQDMIPVPVEDNEAPAAPIITAVDLNSGDATSSKKVTLKWDKPSDDTVRYQYYSWNNIEGNKWKEDNKWPNNEKGHSVEGNVYPGEFTEGEGTYYTQVRAVDAAGNVSGPSETFEVTYDKTAPVISNVKIVGQDDKTKNIGGMVTVTFDMKDLSQIDSSRTRILFGNEKSSDENHAYESVKKPTCIESGEVYNCEAEFNTKNFVSKNHTGTYTLGINPYDSAGNQTSIKPEAFQNLLVDNSGPAIAKVISPTRTELNNKQTVKVIVKDDTGIMNNEVEYYLLKDGAQVGARMQLTCKAAETSGEYECKDTFDTTKYSDGEYGVYFSPVDTFGANRGNKTALSNLTIDNEAPAAPELAATGVKTGGYTNKDSITLNWTKPTGAVEYQYYVWTDNGSKWNEDNKYVEKNVSTQTRTGEFTEGEGTYYIQVRSVDTAGNVSDPSNTFVVTHDTTAPSIPKPAFYDNNGDSVETGRVASTENFTFKLPQGADRYQLKYWNNIENSKFNSKSSAWEVNDLEKRGYMKDATTYMDRFSQSEGTHYFSFSACDAAGNCSDFSDAYVVTYTKPVDGGETETETESESESEDQTTSSQPGGGTTGSGSPTTAISNGTLGQLTTSAFGQAFAAQTPANAFGITNPGVLGATDNTDGDDVLGDRDGADDSERVAQLDTSSNGDVLGDSDSEQKSDDGCWDILGLCWYWWILIIAGLIALWLVIAAALRRRNNSEA